MIKSTMLELFKAAGFEQYKEMNVGEFYKPKNRVAIKTLTPEGEEVKREVTGLVYKGVSKDSYKVTTPEGEFLCTGDHAIFNPEKKEYEKVRNYSSSKALSNKGLVDITIEKVPDEFDILDLEVEGEHSYLSAGILSHNTFGASAKACGIVIKRINPLVDTYHVPFFWISQERANQALMAHLPKITGGEAPNFYASTRVRVTPGDPKEYPTKDGEIIGIVIKIKVYKNKTARPFRETKITMYFEGGIDEDEQYVEMLTKMDIIHQGGAGWCTFTDPVTGQECKLQGIPKIVAYLEQHPESYKKFKEAVDDAFVNFNAKLDATAIEISEEAQFQEEKKELKKRLEEGTASAAEKEVAESGEYLSDEEWEAAAKAADEKTVTSDDYINQKYDEFSKQVDGDDEDEESGTIADIEE